jgi:hypothetical protein
MSKTAAILMGKKARVINEMAPPPKPAEEAAPSAGPDLTAQTLPTASLWPGRILFAAEWLSLAAIFIFMLVKSWLRWMDPLIDFPRDLYMAWRVSEGDLLYKDVTNWYGPLPQLTEGAGFHFFGVGIDTIVWMNIVLTVGVILLLWGIFAMLGNRLSRWVCVATFIVVFVFGHYTGIANYNFIAPYVAQSTYGFAGLMLLLWALLRRNKSARSGWLFLAGLGLAIAYLDKPEPLLASLGALMVYGGAEFLAALRKNPLRTDWRGAFAWAMRALGWVAAGFLALWLPLFLYFWYRGGFSYALLAADYVPHTLLNSRFQDKVEHSHLMQTFFGWDRPQENFLHHLNAGAALVGLLGGMVAIHYFWPRINSHHPLWLLCPVLMVGGAGIAAWLGWRQNHWMDTGMDFVFPVTLAALITVGWCWWAVWQRRAEASRLKALAIVGTAAALMMARMFLHGRIYQFGFFMMPLAVLFVIHLVLVEGCRVQTSGHRFRALLPAIFCALVFFGVFCLARISLQVYARKTAVVGEGRDQFYAFPARVAPNVPIMNPSSGALLNLMIHVFRIKTPNAKTLAVFPEGIAANYHLRVRSPLTELEFHPVALGYVGVDQVVDELKDNPPDAIYLHYRSYGEFGERFFADNEATGRPIMVWIAANYERVAKGGRTRSTVTGNVIDLLTPKPHPNSQPLYLVEPIN